MKRVRRIAAWWLSRPEGYPIQQGCYHGSKIEGLVGILTILFMYTVGLPITVVLWIRYDMRVRRDRRARRQPK